MTNEEFQVATARFAVYPKGPAPLYPILGLASEAGEVAGKLAKFVRGDYTNVATEYLYQDFDKEVGDCLWMISQYCNDTDTTISELMHKNIAKLEARQQRGTIQGSGDDR